MESIAEAIAMEPDMELVDILTSPDALATAVPGRNVDIVIVERLAGDPAVPTTELLYASPRLRVLLISVTGPAVTMHLLRPHEVTLGNMSLNSLLQTIRGERSMSATRSLPDLTVADVHDRRSPG